MHCKLSLKIVPGNISINERMNDECVLLLRHVNSYILYRAFIFACQCFIFVGNKRVSIFNLLLVINVGCYWLNR